MKILNGTFLNRNRPKLNKLKNQKQVKDEYYKMENMQFDR